MPDLSIAVIVITSGTLKPAPTIDTTTPLLLFRSMVAIDAGTLRLQDRAVNPLVAVKINEPEHGPGGPYTGGVPPRFGPFGAVTVIDTGEISVAARA